MYVWAGWDGSGLIRRLLLCSGCEHVCRYQAKPGPLLAGVKTRLKWADGAAVKAEIEAQLAAFLGPKTEADLKPIDKKAKKKKVDPPLCQRALHPQRTHLPVFAYHHCSLPTNHQTHKLIAAEAKAASLVHH